MASLQAMDQYAGSDALISYVLSGVLGPIDGTRVGYSLLNFTDKHFTYCATLDPDKSGRVPLDRYKISIDRLTGRLSTPMKIEITDQDMQRDIQAVRGETVQSSDRLVSEDDHTKINAIIDWELCASAPFLAAHECIEMLFRRRVLREGGDEYPRADELRAAFWTAIPWWKEQQESQAGRDFLEWLPFALLMKPEHGSRDQAKAGKVEFWAENRRVVDKMFETYG